MSVLIDTSVWIEFFAKKPVVDFSQISFLIRDRQVVTCLPVKAEVLSGEMTSGIRKVVQEAFDAMTFVDPDWNQKVIWENLSQLADQARRHRLALPGLIDRMILLTARESHSSLWTLDKKLQRLATYADVELID